MPKTNKRALFKKAIENLGHEISFMENHKISLDKFSKRYSIPMEIIIDAIEQKKIKVHYDYEKETLWLTLLEASYFSYCLDLKNKPNHQSK